MNLEIGDVVRLRSGSPDMVISHRTDRFHDGVVVYWYDDMDRHVVHSLEICLSALVKVESK